MFFLPKYRPPQCLYMQKKNSFMQNRNNCNLYARKRVKDIFSRNAQRGNFFYKPNVSRSFKQIKGLEEKVPNVELSSLTSRCWYCKQPHLMGNSCLVAVRVETTFFFYLFSSSSWLMKSARCEQLRLCTDQQNTGIKNFIERNF